MDENIPNPDGSNPAPPINLLTISINYKAMITKTFLVIYYSYFL